MGTSFITLLRYRSEAVELCSVIRKLEDKNPNFLGAPFNPLATSTQNQIIPEIDLTGKCLAECG
jgi:hypothetical protein